MDMPELESLLRDAEREQDCKFVIGLSHNGWYLKSVRYGWNVRKLSWTQLCDMLRAYARPRNGLPLVLISLPETYIRCIATRSLPPNGIAKTAKAICERAINKIDQGDEPVVDE